jgi:hypothetical protein
MQNYAVRMSAQQHRASCGCMAFTSASAFRNRAALLIGFAAERGATLAFTVGFLFAAIDAIFRS